MTYLLFTDKVTKYFHSCLTNIAFFVSLENAFLEAGFIICGVPQEPVLEPLLFLLYINGISQTMSNSHIYLNAGDISYNLLST